MPIPITLASSRTIACGPVSGARSSRSARVFSIELICSRTSASRRRTCVKTQTQNLRADSARSMEGTRKQDQLVGVVCAHRRRAGEGR